MKKILVFLSLVLCMSLFCSCGGDDNALLSSNDTPNTKNVVILMTGSTHGLETENFDYGKLSKYKNSLKKENHVALVDAGDFTNFNNDELVKLESLEKEEVSAKKKEVLDSAEKKLKQADYDFVALGENEINVGLDDVVSWSKKLKDLIYCANIIDLRTDKKAFSSYKIMKLGNKKVAFISVLTPDIFEKNTYLFRDEDARYIYDILSDKNGEKICKEIQDTVKEVKEKNVNYVVLVGHFGSVSFSRVCNYKTIVESTGDIDVFLDGHSTQNNVQYMNNNQGKRVLFMQVAPDLNSIGQVFITKDGSMSGQCISSDDLN